MPPAVTDEQLDCMAQIFTGQLGGLPWSILGTTFEVAGVVRAEVEITDDGINSGFSIPGVGEAKGESLKNPVTDEDHSSRSISGTGFIWKRGDCGQGIVPGRGRRHRPRIQEQQLDPLRLRLEQPVALS